MAAVSAIRRRSSGFNFSTAPRGSGAAPEDVVAGLQAATTTSLPQNGSQARKLGSLSRRRITCLNLNVSLPGPKQLRRVFKAFDVDNDGHLTGAQFKKGLEVMGFEVTNQQALGSLFRQLDRTGNGLITESAFLRHFRSASRQALQAQLKAGDDDDVWDRARATTSIHKVDIGSKDGKGHLHHEYISVDPTLMERVLKAPAHMQDQVSWVQVGGYDEDTLGHLGQCLKLPPAVVEDLSFIQRPKVKYFPEHDVLHLIIGMVSLQQVPIRPTDNPMPGAEFKLVPHSAYTALPPKLDSMQMHLIVIGNHTLVTFHNCPQLASVWADTEKLLKVQMGNARGPLLFTAKSLATEILDELSAINWLSRDQFKAWKVALERSIRRNARSKHYEHIMDLQRTSMITSNVFEANKEAMKMLTRDQFKDTGRAKFIESAKEDFADVYDSFARLRDQAAFTYDLSTQLQNFFKTCQDDKMNRILYSLTLITTMMAPMTLWAGIYGMNFKSMPELQFDYGYPVWWVVNLLVLVMMGIGFHRGRWW